MKYNLLRNCLFGLKLLFSYFLFYVDNINNIGSILFVDSMLINITFTIIYI